MDGTPPPNAPPHGNHQKTGPDGKASGLPPGNYDIFIIPPHSSGSGFLYLPSLQPHRNSFLAGVACTLSVVGVWVIVIPILRDWFATLLASGGAGVLVLVSVIAVAAWAFGRSQTEAGAAPPPDPHQGTRAPPNPRTGTDQGPQQKEHAGYSSGFTSGTGPDPRSSWQQPKPAAPPGPASEGWAKAREETRKREEERRKREDADKKAKETAEKDKWDKARAREKENRGKEAREKIIQDRMKKESEAKAEAAAAAAAKARAGDSASKVLNGARSAAREAAGISPDHKPYRKPYLDDDEYSYRPYDKAGGHKAHGSNSSFVSTSSYAASQSTARTTPPPSNRGPYSTKDPEKIQIEAVYAVNDLFPAKPIAQLVAGAGNVTDGLVLKMTSEGLFIDDDVRGVGQREWDVKAWTLKLVENGDLARYSILRASVREANNKRYIFVIDAREAWKVAIGLQTLRRCSLIRSLAANSLSAAECQRVLQGLGWV